MRLHKSVIVFTASLFCLTSETFFDTGQSTKRLLLGDPAAIVSASDGTINLGPYLRASIGPNGQTAVAEGDGAYVGLIDARGRLRRIGREGSGPGEFGRGLLVGWHVDTLVVTDASARRTTLFHNGRVVRTVSFVGTASRDGLVDTPLFLTESGAVCPVISTRFARDSGPRSTSLVLASMDGRELLDTLFSLDEPLGRLVIQRSSSTIMQLQPFSASTIVKVSGNGRYFARIQRDAKSSLGGIAGGSGTASLFAGDGRRLYSTVVPVRSSPLDSRMVDYVIDTTLSAINRNRTGSARVTRDEYRRSLITPAFLPSVADAVVSNDGSLLLREWSGLNADSATYFVLNTLGSTRGMFRVPATLTVIAADDRQVISVRELPDGDFQLTRSLWVKK